MIIVRLSRFFSFSSTYSWDSLTVALLGGNKGSVSDFKWMISGRRDREMRDSGFVRKIVNLLVE